MSQQSEELKSLTKHPGWKQVEMYVMNAQATKLNECAKQDASTENILKNIGAFDALKRFMGWIASSSQDSEV